MNKAPYLRAKDFDHEDVSNPLRHDFVLSAITNALAAIGAFVLGIGIWLWWWLA